MRLGVALPFPDFKERFDTKQQTRLWNILRVGHKQITTSDSETEEVYRRRNEYMANQLDLCDAVSDNRYTIRSGTSMAVNLHCKEESTCGIHLSRHSHGNKDIKNNKPVVLVGLSIDKRALDVPVLWYTI